MEAMLNKNSYFTMRDNLKDRETELVKKLKKRLTSSDVANDLFEYLVVRRELGKESLCKDFDEFVQGRMKELSVLIELFRDTE